MLQDFPAQDSDNDKYLSGTMISQKATTAIFLLFYIVGCKPIDIGENTIRYQTGSSILNLT